MLAHSRSFYKTSSFLSAYRNTLSYFKLDFLWLTFYRYLFHLMILPLALVMAAVIPLSSTNPPVEPDASPSPTPEHRERPRMLALMASGIKSIATDEDDELINEVFNPEAPAQRKISAFQPMPSMPHTIKELKYASGSITGSPRDFLSQHGVDLSVVYTGLFIGNPVGGKSQGYAYADNISFNCLLETEKLFGWKGGHFVMSAMQQDGGYQENLSETRIGNQFTVNSIVGGQTIKWVNLYWNQDLWNDRLNVIVGRCCAMDEFDNSPLLWNYIGSLQAAPTNLKTTWSPNASWGSRVKLALTHDTDLRFGVYQITTSSLNGLNWNFYSNDSASFFTQYSWNPQFGEAGSTTLFDHPKKEPATSTEKRAASDKSFKTPVDLSQLKKLPGHYFVGGFYTSEGASPFLTHVSQANSYALYCHADQMVYRPNPLTEAGLILWSELAYSPEANISILSYQIKGGSIYQGLIPGRTNDATIFGLGYGGFSSDYQNYQASQGNGKPIYEVVTELGYRVNVTRFFYVQPDIQYIINPGGAGAIPNALVLGAQVGIVF